jgi:hypothetical protein
MRSATLARLESLLQARRLDVTLPGRRPSDSAGPVVSTGVSALDERLGGGWRGGELSELAGSPSSGRTSLLTASLATAAYAGPVVLVDAVDRFDPASAARAGLALERLLWVRGPALSVELAHGASVDALVQRALRAFDLIVRAGGFALAALDLADVPLRYLQRLPAATWLRIARANEGRPTAGLLIVPAPVGRSPRGASVVIQGEARWTGASPQARRFLGFRPIIRHGNFELHRSTSKVDLRRSAARG